MEAKNISTNIANGTVHYIDHMESISNVKWQKHPSFKGVYLKLIISGTDTLGVFSSHLVKIDPECCLEAHCHENQMELHEVIEGEGIFQLVEDSFEYHPGKISVTPKGKKHMVKAGKKGLTLMAKFFPAMS